MFPGECMLFCFPGLKRACHLQMRSLCSGKLQEERLGLSRRVVSNHGLANRFVV